MKTIVSVGAAIALVLSFAVAAIPAQAQVGNELGIDWSTTFTIQNLGTSGATGSILFYDENGSTIQTVSLTAPSNKDADGGEIPAGGSRAYVVADIPDTQSGGFDGSAVVESTQELAVIYNVQGNVYNPSATNYYGSGPGFDTGATEIGLPLVQRQPVPGFDTWFVVQNISAEEATVEAEFVPATAGVAYTTTPVNIPAYASRKFSTAELSSSIVDGDGRFVGSVTVRSTDEPGKELVAVVNQTGTLATGNRVVNTYGAFTPAEAEDTLNLPLVQEANAGFRSGISIQNVGTVTTTVTLTFNQATRGTTPNPNVFTFEDVAPGDGVNFNTFREDQFGAGNVNVRYVGSATVTTNPPSEIVGIVNQNRFAGTVAEEPTGVGTSYESFAPSSATTHVSAPLIMSNNGGFYTSINCQNTTSTDTTISITYTENAQDNGFQPTDVTGEELLGDGSFVRSQAVVDNFGSGTESGGEKRYVGGATIEAGQPIVCVINQQSFPATAGDTFLTYNGINFTP
jgi:hypothetical protein